MTTRKVLGIGLVVLVLISAGGYGLYWFGMMRGMNMGGMNMGG